MGIDMVREVKRANYPSSKEKESRIRNNYSKDNDVKFVRNDRKLFSRGD